MEEGHDEDHDDMRVAGGSHDFFEIEFINRFDGWSISFQTLHDEPEERRVNQGLLHAGLGYNQRNSLFLAFS
jgi:hypothetical protein